MLDEAEAAAIAQWLGQPFEQLSSFGNRCRERLE
jgi:hypothetical protein